MTIEPFSGGTNQENTAPDNKVKYPKNWIQETSAGHRIEMNNTEEFERIRILNGNGNFLDLDELNNNTLKSYNDTYILSQTFLHKSLKNIILAPFDLTKFRST